MNIIAPILLGLFSSVHCIGMCGPIITMVFINKKKSTLKFIIYILGKTLTYSVFGLMFGLIGTGINISGYQQSLSVFIGVSIIFLAIPSNKIKIDFFLFKKIHLLLSKLIHSSKLINMFTIGILNGFLPCGLVYIAIASATEQGSILKSVFFMSLFGLSTFPSLLLVKIIGSSKMIKNRKLFNLIMKIFIILLGFVIILRGFNLKIPYISPDISNPFNEDFNCH